MVVELITPEHSLRALAEKAVQEKYSQEFGATIERLPTHLIGLHHEAHGLEAVAGLRLAESGFFSECYLDAPIERILRQRCGQAVQRDQVVEVSNLVGIRPKAALPLVHFIIQLAMNLEMQWAFFTATEPLSKLLLRAKIPLEFITEAEPAKVGTPDVWGSYYAHNPAVFAVNRAKVAAALKAKRKVTACCEGALHV